MVQKVILANFKSQVLQWDGVKVPTKESIGLLGKNYLTSCKICKVIMQTAEPVYTREATDRLAKILDSTYAKAYLEQLAANATQTNTEEITQLLRILEYFGDFFGGNLGDWGTDPVYFELNSDSKPFNCKYYPVPRLNKYTFSQIATMIIEKRSVNSSKTVSIRYSHI